MTANWDGTYRLQLHAEFSLDDAIGILPYLAELGVSHVYLSPCLQAVPGSMHGYDVADPSKVSADLGGEAAWTRFVDAAKRQQLKILLDIVPNHMSASQHNPWWDNVLAHGPYSEFAQFFDFRKAAGQPFLVHLCTLARPFGDAVAAAELSLELVDDHLRVRHYDNTWPLSPCSWGELLQEHHTCFSELEALQRITTVLESDRRRYAEHASRAEEILRGAAADGRLEQAIERAKTDADFLVRVLEHQFFQLHWWKLAGELGNYRRFFDVGGLAGVRAELPEVFDASHERIAAMVERGDVDGLRIDHPDGLRNPLEYFQRLRKILPDGRIYVEKILENDERLREDWPISGTVGYEFMAKVNRLWMDDQRADVLTATYADFTGHTVNFARLVRQKKNEIVESTFSAELDQLVAGALDIARSSWRTRDLSPKNLHDALSAVTTAFGIYRTYRTDKGALHEDDRRALSDAVQSARIGAPQIHAVAFDFLLELFTKEGLTDAEADFVARWQQLAPPVMAKGVEDTTFYLFDRLVSCNEVGSQASLIGISGERFHEFCHYLSDRWPDNLLATSTHDNKRSEDVRTRISLLSEIPERWGEVLHAWSQLTAGAWKNRTPDRHAEYLLYQTLIGAWPIDEQRCWQYMLKACREAKVRTSWHEPNVGYEENIRGFIQGIYESREFLDALEKFVEPLVLPGRINSLSQTFIKMLAPGVPDFYQGTELWDLSLVDPDNRRPVDFAVRLELLRRCRSLSVAEVVSDWDSGLPKLWMTSRVLAVRRARSADFSAVAKYQPLVAQGSHLGNLFAFRRGENVIGVVPRFRMSLGGDWEDTVLPLPRGEWRNSFTGGVLQGPTAPRDLFGEFPVALLIREDV